jgi:hypothetical protein
MARPLFMSIFLLMFIATISSPVASEKGCLPVFSLLSHDGAFRYCLSLFRL